MEATGVQIPVDNCNILVSIQEKIRDDFEPTLKKMADLGFKLHATEETAQFLRDRDIPGNTHTQNYRLQRPIFFFTTGGRKAKTKGRRVRALQWSGESGGVDGGALGTW